MSGRQKTPIGIHRKGASRRGRSGGHPARTLAQLTKPETFGRDGGYGGVGIIDFAEMRIFGSPPRLLIGFCRRSGPPEYGQIALLPDAIMRDTATRSANANAKR